MYELHIVRGKREVEILVTLLAPFANRGCNKYTSIAHIFSMVYIRIRSHVSPITYSKEPVGGLLRNLPPQELGLYPLLGPAGDQKGRQGQEGPVFQD